MTPSREAVRQAVLAEHVKRVNDQAPPLTAEQIARLRALLGGAR